MTDINNVSHTYVRDPSIVAPGARPLPALRKKLFHSFDGTFGYSKKDPIKIYLRIKPVVHKENIFVPPESQTFKVINGTTLTARCVKQTSHGKSLVSHRYTFTKIFEGNIEQKKLFQESVQGAVKDFICGKNALLFAYGTTNAGKTHTMIGSTQQPGIVPRSIHQLFHAIKGSLGSLKLKPSNVNSVIRLDEECLTKELEFKNRILHWNPQSVDTTKLSTNSQMSDDSCSSKRLGNPVPDDTCDFISFSFREMEDRFKDDSFESLLENDGSVYTVWVAFAEIYNESIFDLLEARSVKERDRKTLTLGTDSQGHTFIKGLRYVPVMSGDEAYHVMLYGKHNLHCGSTNLNDVSSRSHCIFTIKLVRSPNINSPTHASVSSYSFCDLAGSERVKKTLNEGKQLTESININTSLHVLGKCMKTIRDNQKGQGRFDQSLVPYRESKLTRLFHRALLGYETVSMVVNISTDYILVPETLHVLKFSAIAKQIVLEHPPKIRPLKQSTRFSQIASKHSKRLTIAWDAADGDITGSTNQSYGDMSQHNETQSIALLNLVEELKKQLKSERQKNLQLEVNVRVELTERFAQMMQDIEARHRLSLEELEMQNEKFVTGRINDMQHFYEMKRKRIDDDMADDAVVITELQDEVENIKKENDILKELHEESLQKTEKLRIGNSRLQFEVSNLQTLLAAAQDSIKLFNNKSEDQDDSDLQSQLSTALADIVTKQRTIEDLKTLLDEAKLEYEKFTTENHNLELEVQKLEQLLLEKEDALEELTNSIAESQQQVAEFKTSKKHEIKEMKSTIAVLQLQIKELQQTNDDFGRTSHCNSVEGGASLYDAKGGEDLQDKILSLEEELKKLKVGPTHEEEKQMLCAEVQALKTGNEHLQNENKSLSLQLAAQNNDSVKDQEIINLEKEVKNLLQMNRNLEVDIESKNNEIQAFERDLKQAMQALRSAEIACQVEKDNMQALKIDHQGKMERCLSQLSAYAKHEDFVKNLQIEGEKLITEITQLKEENETLLERIASMNSDMELLKERRDKQFKQYEDIIRREKEESERHKREVNSLQDCLYKKTPTPVKNDQLRRLQEEIQAKDCEINKLQKEVQVYKLQFKMQEHKSARSISNTSVIQEQNRNSGNLEVCVQNCLAKVKATPYKCQRNKQNADFFDENQANLDTAKSTRKTVRRKTAMSERKGRKETKENDPDLLAGSLPRNLSKKRDASAQESNIKDEPQSTEKPKKKTVAKKKLFSHNDSLVELEPDESQDVPMSTTLNPVDYVMRTLRSRPK